MGLRADFLLKPDLREFQVEYVDGVPLARVRLNLKFVQMPQRTIVANTTVEESAPANGRAMDAIVLAFDDALGKAMKRVVEWTLRQPDWAG